MNGDTELWNDWSDSEPVLSRAALTPNDAPGDGGEQSGAQDAAGNESATGGAPPRTLSNDDLNDFALDLGLTDDDVLAAANLFDGVNISRDAGHQVLTKYREAVDAERERQTKADAADFDAAIAALEADWGDRVDAKIDAIEKAAGELPFGAALLSARGPDGRSLLANPDFLRWLDATLGGG